jgi:hypothetical protein
VTRVRGWWTDLRFALDGLRYSRPVQGTAAGVVLVLISVVVWVLWPTASGAPQPPKPVPSMSAISGATVSEGRYQRPPLRSTALPDRGPGRVVTTPAPHSALDSAGPECRHAVESAEQFLGRHTLTDLQVGSDAEREWDTLSRGMTTQCSKEAYAEFVATTLTQWKRAGSSG